MPRSKPCFVLVGLCVALSLSACGRKPPVATAPITLADDTRVASAPDNLQAALPNAVPGGELELPPADLDASSGNQVASNVVAADVASNAIATDVPGIDQVASDTAASAAEAKRIADEAAKAEAVKREAEAKRKADEEAAAAAKKAAEEAEKRKAEQQAAMTPRYSRVIGEGGLYGAQALCISSGSIYVVDNARTGLLGPFAAIRKYDLATGEYAKLSFENLGLLGVKNLPVGIKAVKVENTKVITTDGTTQWTFDAGANLLKSEPGSFAPPAKLTLPGKTDSIVIKDGVLQRVEADGDLVVTFGQKEVNKATALALDEAGNLYVCDAGPKARVVVFTAPKE
ncbi:MAG: hypothetical protein VKP62_03605 [Candidatus Sericytochromatia bacterium]|nr:hypothetical protein [Candidatus Sericytochromatia bacterium]